MILIKLRLLRFGKILIREMIRDGIDFLKIQDIRRN